MKVITIASRNITQFPGMEIRIIQEDEQATIGLYDALTLNRFIAGSGSFDPRIGKLIEADIIGALTDPESYHVDVDNFIAVFNARQKLAESLTPEHLQFMELEEVEMKAHPMLGEMKQKGLVQGNGYGGIESTSLWRNVMKVFKALIPPTF